MKTYFEYLNEEHHSEPKPLYVARDVINGEEILNHFKEQLPDCPLLQVGDLHVTVCYSKEPVIWDNIHKGVPDHENIVAGDKRQMKIFGQSNDSKCLVMVVPCDALEDRHNHMRAMGASFDFDQYEPHVTLSYAFNTEQHNVENIEPFRGVIHLGPEKFEAIDQDYADKVKQE